jgi:hypothetical protein
VRPDYFDVFQIYLAAGSVSTPERKNFVERICCLYPEAKITKYLVTTVPLNRLTLGGICSYKAAQTLMERKAGTGNAISLNIDATLKSGDGRARYSPSLRQEMYSLVVKTARNYHPDLELALCLEDKEIWQNIGLEKSIGHCNCGL